jgi:hypothetical protein
MRWLLASVMLVCGGPCLACPSPSLPSRYVLDEYVELFGGLVIGVSLAREGYGEEWIQSALTDKKTIFVSDNGPAYDVNVLITKRYKGKNARDGWLSIKQGCFTSIPSLLENGIFAVDRSGEVLAIYEQAKEEFFGYADVLTSAEETYPSARSRKPGKND